MISEQQLAQIRRVLAERGQANIGTFVDGLQSLIEQAKAGQPAARAALRQLRAGLRELEALGLDVELPGRN